MLDLPICQYNIQQIRMSPKAFFGWKLINPCQLY
uniref:Uncharacterized protein n=1 Tax=Anguilla anguilla TaxID=7936 RepID=A0A0E9VQE0_ANGAN